MAIWGSNANNTSKPSWKWLATSRGDKLANVFATAKGWCLRWPWGDEVLVGIGGLDTNLGVPVMAGIEVESTTLSNVNPSTVSFRLLFDEGVSVNGTPTLLAIGTNTANVTLTYSSADSDPTAGKLVFKNTAVNLSAATNSSSFTVNSTSTFQGNLVLDLASQGAVSNTVVGSNSVSVVS